MTATDFWFDNNLASEFGLVIASIGGNNDDVASGGEIEFTVAKPPSRDKFNQYTSNFNEPLSWSFTIIKDPCKYDNDEMYFDINEEREIVKWLSKTDGYRWFRFVQEEPEDIYYNVNINVKPNQFGGATVGFDLTVTSDCGYGFSKLIQKNITINSNTSFIINVDTDVYEYLYPIVTINGSGNFNIYNNNDLEQNFGNRVSAFTNFDNTTAVMNSENEIISGINAGQFNFYFLRLLNGKNEIKTNSTSDITLKFEYREARRVIF